MLFCFQELRYIVLHQYGRKKIDTGLIDIIDADVTKTKDDPGSGLDSDKLNHWYYYTSTEVVDDVIEVLKGKKSGFAVKKQNRFLSPGNFFAGTNFYNKKYFL